MNNKLCDSLSVVKYFGALRHISGYEFIEFDNKGIQPVHKLEILTIENQKIVLNAYKYGDFDVLESSQNPGTFFNGKSDSSFQKIFCSRPEF